MRPSVAAGFRHNWIRLAPLHMNPLHLDPLQLDPPQLDPLHLAGHHLDSLRLNPLLLHIDLVHYLYRHCRLRMPCRDRAMLQQGLAIWSRCMPKHFPTERAHTKQTWLTWLGTTYTTQATSLLRIIIVLAET